MYNILAGGMVISHHSTVIGCNVWSPGRGVAISHCSTVICCNIRSPGRGVAKWPFPTVALWLVVMYYLLAGVWPFPTVALWLVVISVSWQGCVVFSHCSTMIGCNLQCPGRGVWSFSHCSTVIGCNVQCPGSGCGHFRLSLCSILPQSAMLVASWHATTTILQMNISTCSSDFTGKR